MEQNNENKMTKYDRKMLARKENAKREKKKDFANIAFAITLVVCIAAVLIIAPILKNRELYKEYFKINNESVSELEFNFHNTNLINNNSQYLQMFGMSSMEDLDTMVYDQESGLTWSQYFAERAAESIKENRALIADAKAKGVDLDIKADYKEHMDQVAAQAETAGMTTDAYLSALYGANEKQLKNIIKDNLMAVAYSQKLYDDNLATDEAVQAEYDENKNNYDSIDYRVLSFTPTILEGATEEETTAAKNDAKAKAQEMLDKVNAGEDFETLCATYAAEDERTLYADTETDRSLVTGETASYSYGPYSSWLFEEHTAGDTTLYTDETTGVCYVLRFEKRYMGDNVLDVIKQDLTYNTVMEYVAEVSKDYTISDPDDNLPTL